MVGCDFDQNRLDTGRAAGLHLVCGGIDVLEKEDFQADLIILSHVLEHLPDVDDALRKAAGMLADNGRLYIEVPGIRALNRPRHMAIRDEWMISNNNFLNYLQLEHNYCFEQLTLDAFAGRAGFEKIRNDEYIRAIYVKTDPDSADMAMQADRGEDVFGYLKAVEQDWQRHNPSWKKIARVARNSFACLDWLARRLPGRSAC